MPYQLIYSSESSTPMQMDELEDILTNARANNAARGITGALVYVDGFFLQILEGEPSAVHELMQRISRDVRHKTISILKQGETAEAVFGDWKMAYVSATAEQVAIWAGLDGTTALPEVLTDMHNDPFKVAQVAQSILSVIAAEPNAAPKSGQRSAA